MVHRALTAVAMFVLALAASISAFGSPAEPSRYTFDHRSIYLDGKPIFTLPKDEIDGDFEGPIPFGQRIVFIETTRNLVLGFDGSQLAERKTMFPNASRQDYPMYNVTLGVIRTSQGLIIYNSHGEARLLMETFGVKRIRSLDVDPDRDGVPRLSAWKSIQSGKQRLIVSVRAKDDRYLILDLDEMKVVERGATAKDAAATAKSSP